MGHYLKNIQQSCGTYQHQLALYLANKNSNILVILQIVIVLNFCGSNRKAIGYETVNLSSADEESLFEMEDFDDETEYMDDEKALIFFC
uniref:Uncharacterized protein n=1 Tax=Romanomermis culicivorax TaxID=13658 RepID=A0A915K8S0_ROMCU